MRKATLFAGLLTLFLQTPVWGQAIPAPNPTGWVNLPMQRTIMGNLLNNATRGQSQAMAPHAAQAPPSAASSTFGPARATPLNFSEDPAVTAHVEQETINDLRQRKGDKAAQALQQFLSRTDFRAVWSQMVAADRLQRNSLVDIITAEWVLSWVIANHGDNTRAQTLGTRAQVEQAVASNPSLLRMTDAQRQAFGETLMLDQVVVASGYLAARRSGNQVAMNTIGENARRDFSQAFGMDLTAYTLTDTGLRLKR